MLECHDKEIYKALADAVLQLPLSALLEHFVDMQLPAPSSQDTLPVADPSWSSQGQPPSILSRQDTLPSEDPLWPYQGQPAPSSLSRQDTLPSEDPSWSYSRVQGQPAPIPPHNEPLLYIPNNVVDEVALKNLQPRVLPTTFKSIMNGMRTDRTTAGDFGKIPSFLEVRIIDGSLSCLQ